MAKIKSAKKAHRASLKRRVFNARRTKAMKGAVKDIGKLIGSKDGKGAAAMLPALYKAIDKSRLTKRIRAIVG